MNRAQAKFGLLLIKLLCFINKMIKSRLNTACRVHWSKLLISLSGALYEKTNLQPYCKCNPTVNVKLLGFLGVIPLWPLHDIWVSDDHEWDSAQLEQHSAEVSMGLLSQLPFFTYRHFCNLHTLHKVVLETSLFPTLNVDFDF